MSGRRIVVTGIGVLTPLGNDLPSTWANLLAGRSGIAPITRFDATGYSTTFAGEVKGFEPAGAFKNPKDARRCDRYTQLAFGATKQAFADSGLDPARLDPTRCGVIVGSGIGGLQTLEEQHSVLRDKGPGRVSPFMIPMMISNIASGLIAIDFNFQGPNFAIVTACATSNQSIGEAWRQIRDDEADVMIAGGSEAAVVPLGLCGFGSMKALSTRNDAPEKASRPWDKDRDGFVLGEGAGILILEELEHAKKRGARIYGEIAGYGASCDAYHMTSPTPDGSGVARAITSAMRHAGVNGAEVDYINAHATSTNLGDIAETKALKLALGEEAARKTWVNSTKSMIGHLLGAAGAVEMAVCLKAIETGDVPPTINLDEPDPECDLDYVPKTARHKDVRVAMNNSFGFGGHNSCVIARKLV
ncbi:MAG: beta-ketoacyl-ACP synthase II [Candidatus Methylacidiphilales bacterium]|nr:beta-ketoacyl-ACP synthase II [Candidatus Methylacidiphilales bacterium]